MPLIGTLLGLISLGVKTGKLIYETVDEIRQENKRQREALAKARKEQADKYAEASKNAGHSTETSCGKVVH